MDEADPGGDFNLGWLLPLCLSGRGRRVGATPSQPNKNATLPATGTHRLPTAHRGDAYRQVGEEPLENQGMRKPGRYRLVSRAIVIGVVSRSTDSLATQASLIDEASRPRFRVERVALSASRLPSSEDETDRQMARRELTEILSDLVFPSQTLEYHPEHLGSPDTVEHDDLDLSRGRDRGQIAPFDLPNCPQLQSCGFRCAS